MCKLFLADIFGQLNNVSEDYVQLFESYLCKLLNIPATVLEDTTHLTDSSTTECIDWVNPLVTCVQNVVGITANYSPALT